MTTAILSLTEIQQSQASKYASHNEALAQIEGRTIRALSRATAAQPASPAEGDVYILPASPTGTDWAGYTAGDIAHFYGGAWHSYTPVEGLRLWVNDENQTVAYDGAAWIINPASLGVGQVTTEKLADFAEDTTTSGLTWGYKAGTIRTDSTLTRVGAGTVALTASTTNYVEVDAAGTVSVNQAGFTPGRIPLRALVTDASAITGDTDERAWLYPMGNFSVGQLGDFAEDPAATTGLTWGYRAGRVRNDNAVTDVAAGTVTLTASTTNYVELTPAGSVSVNQSGFTAGRIPLRTLVTGASAITTSTDRRAWVTASSAGTGASSIPDFAQDTASTTGLDYGYKAGNLRNGSTVIPVAAGTVTCTASTTNYVEIDSAGAVSVNQAGFTAGRIPLAEVVTDASAITGVTDRRAWLQFAGGDFKSDGSVPMAGDLNLAGYALKNYTERSAAVTASTATTTLDLSQARKFNIAMQADTTLAFSNLPASGVVSVTLKATQDTTGGRTLAPPSGTLTPGGKGITLSTAAGAEDWIEMVKDGAGAWRAFMPGAGMA